MSHMLYNISTNQEKPTELLIQLVNKKGSFWLIGICLRFLGNLNVIQYPNSSPSSCYVQTMMEYIQKSYGGKDKVPEIFLQQQQDLSFCTLLALDRAGDKITTFSQLTEAVQAQALDSIRKSLYKFPLSDWEALLSLCIEYLDFGVYEMIIEILGFPYHLSNTVLTQLVQEYQMEKKKGTELWKVEIFKRMIEKSISYGAHFNFLQFPLGEFRQVYENEPLWKKITKASGEMIDGYYTYGKDGAIQLSFPVPRSLDPRLYSIAVALGFTHPWDNVPMALYRNVFSQLAKEPPSTNKDENFSVLRPHAYLYSEPILKSKYYSIASDTYFYFCYPNYEQIIRTGKNPITNEPVPFEFLKEIQGKIEFMEKYGIKEILTIPEALSRLEQNDRIQFSPKELG